MKKILTILLIYTILSAFPFTGCDNTAQENSNNENPHITVEERTISQEVTNTETTVVPEATSNNGIQSTEQTSDSYTTTEDAIPEEEIELSKTYFNETFQFEIKYPGIWSLIEEDIVPEVRLHGAYLFFGNSNVTEIDNENIIDVDHIHAYGITSPVDMPEAGMTIGELITDDGTKVKLR